VIRILRGRAEWEILEKEYWEEILNKIGKIQVNSPHEHNSKHTSLHT
jgi:hypothetical protein